MEKKEVAYMIDLDNRIVPVLKRLVEIKREGGWSLTGLAEYVAQNPKKSNDQKIEEVAMIKAQAKIDKEAEEKAEADKIAKAEADLKEAENKLRAKSKEDKKPAVKADAKEKKE